MSILSEVFWIKNHIFRDKAIKEYKTALQNELKTSEEIAEINFRKRKRLLHFAYDNSKFYKDFYDQHNFHPEDFTTPIQWRYVPILEKSHIRHSSLLQISFNKKKLIKTTTGGSTGRPIRTFRDKSFPEEIIKWRMLKRWNISPASNVAMFWRIPKKNKKLFNKTINQLIWWPTKRLSLDASFFNEEKLNKITHQINKLRPELFWGYVGALEQYALFLKKNRLKISKPECLWVTAAPISKVQKTLFRENITGNILNQYACSEIHWVASNTPGTDNLIVDYDYRHVDIVDKQNHPCKINEIGDILLTDLENNVFPLIKYRVGDKSMFITERNKLAPGFPMIAPVKGRISDYIKTKNNIILNGEYLTTVFDHQSDVVQQFQIHQTDSENVVINVVLNQGFNESHIDDNILLDLKRKTNNELDFRVHIKEYIQSDRGKIRFIINDTL